MFNVHIYCLVGRIKNKARMTFKNLEYIYYLVIKCVLMIYMQKKVNYLWYDKENQSLLDFIYFKGNYGFCFMYL